MSRRAFTAFFSLLALSAHLHARDTHDIPRAPSRPRFPTELENAVVIINGDEVEDNREDGSYAVGMLYIKDGPEKAKFGTGTALCPNVVLTASHVAEHMKHGLEFVVGKDAKGDYEAGRRKGRKVVESFSLKEGDGAVKFVGDPKDKSQVNIHSMATDLALVRLEKPIGKGQFTFGKLAEPGPIPDRDLEAIGYGKFTAKGKFNEPGEAGTRRSGRFRHKEIHWAKDKSYGSLESKADKRGQLPSSADSGAPVFQTDKDGKRDGIIGVHTNGIPGERAWAALTGPHYEALQKKLKEWCPKD